MSVYINVLLPYVMIDFFAGAELAVADLATFINNGVAEYRKLARELDAAKDNLANKVAAAEAKAKEAEVREAIALAAAETVEAEVTSLTRRMQRRQR